MNKIYSLLIAALSFFCFSGCNKKSDTQLTDLGIGHTKDLTLAADIELPTGNHRAVIKLKGEKARTDIESFGISTILSASGEQFLLNHKTKTIEKEAEPVSTLSKDQLASFAKAIVMKYTGKTEKIAGWETREFLMLDLSEGVPVNEQFRMVAWIADDFPEGRDIQRLIDRVTPNQTIASLEKAGAKKLTLPGFALRFETYIAGKQVAKITYTAIRQGELPASDFELPKDYLQSLNQSKQAEVEARPNAIRSRTEATKSPAGAVSGVLAKQIDSVTPPTVKNGTSTGIVRTQSQYEWAKAFAVDGIRVGAQWSDIRAKFTDAIPLIVPTNDVSSWKITTEHGLREADYVNVQVFEGKIYSLHTAYSGETAKRVGGFEGIREQLSKGIGEPDKTYSTLARWEGSLASEDLLFSVFHLDKLGKVILSVDQPMVAKRAWPRVLPQWNQAHAWNLRVAKRYEFPEKKHAGFTRPLFSRDFRRIYYVDRETVNSGEDQCHLVEFSLEEQKVMRRFAMPCGNPVCATVSPDEKKVMVSWGGRLCQINLESGKATEFTVSESGRVQDIAWPEEKRLLVEMFSNVAWGYYELDLETLTLRRLEKCPSQLESGRFQKSKHPNIRFEIQSLNLKKNISSHKELCATSRTDTYSRQFSDDPHIGDNNWVVWSPDLRYVLYSKFNSMVMLRLDVRPTSFLQYDVAGIESRFSASQRQKINQAFLSGRRIWLNVYEPRINPLNGRVVGPDPEKMKGQGYLTQIQPTIRFKYTFEESPVIQGDVVSNVDIDGEEHMGIRWPWGHDVWGVLSKPFEGER